MSTPRLLLCTVASVCITASVAAQSATQAPLTIPAAEFASRREALAARVENGVVVAFGGRALVHDFHTFFQIPSFHYLTNYDEPDGAFVMVVRDKKGVATLFTTQMDVRSALYYGQRADSASTTKRYGMNGRSFVALRSVLDSLASSGLPFYTITDAEDLDFAPEDSLTRGGQFMKAFAAAHPAVAMKDALPFVLELRAKKSAAELALIRRAVEISSEGHRAAMRVADVSNEYDLRAALEYTFIKLGAQRPAYGSIVGAGVNGTTLHYMKDTGPAKAGDMVVMDAAAEYRGYAADITRSIPVNGKYSAEQRALYQMVRDAQDAAERNSAAGKSRAAAAESSFVVRAKGLAALGLTQGVDATFDPPWDVNCTRSPNQCKQTTFWTIHGINHGLGLAVHDPVQADFSDRTFKVGDAFVIEPGIYINPAALDLLPDTPKNRAFIAAVRAKVTQYQNIGVRVEDCYFITEKGLERISMAPREIAEIEALMRQRRPIP